MILPLLDNFETLRLLGNKCNAALLNIPRTLELVKPTDVSKFLQPQNKTLVDKMLFIVHEQQRKKDSWDKNPDKNAVNILKWQFWCCDTT